MRERQRYIGRGDDVHQQTQPDWSQRLLSLCGKSDDNIKLTSPPRSKVQ